MYKKKSQMYYTACQEYIHIQSHLDTHTASNNISAISIFCMNPHIWNWKYKSPYYSKSEWYCITKYQLDKTACIELPLSLTPEKYYPKKVNKIFIHYKKI